MDNGLNALMLLLMSWIGEHSAYVIPPTAPQILFIEQQQLAAISCNRHCPVKGWYPTEQADGGKILYLINGLDLNQDVCSRSVLLHELVHYVQDYNHAFSNREDSEIVVYTEREMEAIRLERLYSMEHNARCRARQVLLDPRIPRKP